MLAEGNRHTGHEHRGIGSHLRDRCGSFSSVADGAAAVTATCQAAAVPFDQHPGEQGGQPHCRQQQEKCDEISNEDSNDNHTTVRQPELSERRDDNRTALLVEQGVSVLTFQ